MPIDAYITSSLLRIFKTAVGVCSSKPDKPTLEICSELIECGCTVDYFGCEAFEDNVTRAEKVIGYTKKQILLR